MADVRVEMFPDAEERMLSAAKGAVSSLAADICAKANGLASEGSGTWHIYKGSRVSAPGNGPWRDLTWFKPDGGMQTRGPTAPLYRYKPAEMRGGKPIGIVYTGNYAAKKDNMKNNTLLKAR